MLALNIIATLWTNEEQIWTENSLTTNNVPAVPEKWYSASRHNEKACPHSFDHFLYKFKQICFQPKPVKKHLQGDT